MYVQIQKEDYSSNKNHSSNDDEDTYNYNHIGNTQNASKMMITASGYMRVTTTIYIYTSIHTYLPTDLPTYIHTYVHTYTHTHTRVS